MNILQRILMPDPKICTRDDMYFRIQSDEKDIIYNSEQQEYHLNKGDYLTGNTYFNCFSSPKWSKYTIIDKLKIHLDLEGKFRISLYKSFISDENIINNKIKEKYFDSSINEHFNLEYDFSLDQFNGIYYLKIESLEDNSIFRGGYYYSDQEVLNDIKIGVVICTFKREKFIYKNLELFKHILNKESSILFNKLEVFIIDNARSLNIEDFQEKYLHLIPNKNLGGAGGFTRGIIEILESKSNFTHILLMDDDALVDLSSIEKTMNFLKYTKKEYQNLFISGSTLRLDQQNIQLESAAVWNNNTLFNLKSNLNLEKLRDILYNELDESKSYGAWVFNCIPISKISDKNLPLPLFVRGDDMEFGIRNSEELLTMNGICAWHAPLHNKYSSFMLYYTIRNQLVLNALYDKNFTCNAATTLLFRNIIRELFLYRYENIELIFKAYEDFLRGVPFFMKTDAETLHKDIMKYSPNFMSFSELSRTDFPFLYHKLNQSLSQLHWRKKEKIIRILRIFTLNGYLLPMSLFKKDSKYAVVDLCRAKPVNFFLNRTVLQVDLENSRGYITQINKTEFIKTWKRFIKLYLYMKSGGYQKAIYSYKKNIHKISNIQFWKKYLQMK